MNILSTIFGSENVINKAANGIDVAFFTKEEKAKHFLETLKHYEPFKLAQRLMAITVCVPYVLTYLVSAGLLVASIFIDNGLVEVSKSLAIMNNDTLGLPFALIIGFYFAGGIGNGLIDKFKGK